MLRALALALLALSCGRSRSPDQVVPADGMSATAGTGEDSAGGQSAGRSGAGSSGLEGAAAGQAAQGPAEIVYQRRPQERPFPLEVDETFLYWGEGGEQWRMLKAPKSGAGPVEEVGPWQGREASVQAIVVDSTHVYWLDHDLIRKVDKVSAAASEITIGESPSAAGWVLTSDKDTLYFSDHRCGTVARVAKTGGEPTQFVSLPYVGSAGSALAVDDDSLYCGGGRVIFRFPKKGGQATQLATVAEGERVGALVSDSVNLYWANNRSILGTRQENLATIPKAGGAIVDLGNTGVGSTIIGADPARVALYWTTKSSSVYDRVLSFSIADAKLTILAEGYPVFGGNAQDDSYVYWAGQTAIMRLAK